MRRPLPVQGRILLDLRHPLPLENIAFIIDGPLAIYGQPAKLHAYILRYLHQLRDKGFIYFGVIKSGRLKDHFTILEERLKQQGINIPYNSFMLVNDEYRFKYIQRRPKQNKYFGIEVLYGQDFLFYSDKGKKYVISLPYPVPEKMNQLLKNISLTIILTVHYQLY